MVILYVYAIRQSQVPAEASLRASQAATKCQAQISSIATPGSLPERYSVVLQELQLELLRHDMNLESSASQQTDNEVTASQSSMIGENMTLGTDRSNDSGVMAFDYSLAAGNAELSVNDGSLELSNASPTSSIAHITGWDKFDSFVGLFQVAMH